MTFFKKISSMAAPLALALGLSAPAPATAQGVGDQYIGQMMLVGFTFCPRGWAEANGQLLSIAQYSALFSLYGVTYGGDGRTSFGLPDLRGRAPIHTGTGPGLSPRSLGQRFGQETVTLTTPEMPSHNHIVNSTFLDGNKNGPGTDFLAVPSDEATGTKYDDLDIYHEGPPNRTMDPAMIAHTGGGLAHNNMPPVLVMRWCVALEGLFPPRD